MIRFPLKNCSTFKSNTAVLPGVFKIPANRVLSSNRHHPKIRFIQALPSYLGFPNQSRRYMDEEDVSRKTSPPLINACATGVIQYPLYLQYPHESCPAAASLINSQVTINSKEQRETRREKPRCNICKRDFSRKSSLIVHMRKHNGEKPYKCTHCPKAFTQSANLITHVRTHTGEKPYACSVCGKCFSQSSSVTTHMRTHTGERPFRCADCGMAFAERSTLSKHFRVHNRKRNLKAISKQGWV